MQQPAPNVAPHMASTHLAPAAVAAPSAPGPAPSGGAPAAPAATPGAAGPSAAAAAPRAAAPAATRQKKRKYGQERQAVPEKVSTVVPESALYNHLLDLDRLVTDTINRRKADFKEPFPPYHEPVKRTLRLTVQAHYHNQPKPPRPPIVIPPTAAIAGPSAGNAAAMAANCELMFSDPAAAAAAAIGGDAAEGGGAAAAAAAAAAEPLEPPSWTLAVTGVLVDPADQLVRAAVTAAAAAAQRGDPSSTVLMLQAQQLATQHAAQQAQAVASGAARTTYLTSVARRIEVHLDPQLYPGEAGRVVWDKAAHTGLNREAVEVRRLGSRSCKATVLIWPDYQPERYVLPPALSEVLGMVHGHETRSRVMVALYGFIKSRRLQDPKNQLNINLTDQLAQVFGCRTLKLSDLSSRLSALLVPVPPVRVEYLIKLDHLKPQPSKASSSSSPPALSGVCDMELLDVDFFTPSPLPHQMGAVLQSYYKDKEIEAMDTKLGGLIRRLNECRRRRTLLLGFAHSPIDMTHALLAAQARDVRMARQGSGRDYELERRTDVFRQRWVEDAVMNYLHKRMGRPLDTTGGAGGADSA